MIEGVLGSDLQDGVLLLTLNRPEAMNALNGELLTALGAALERIQEDDEVRVAVITGTGRAFSAGADLKERASHDRQTGQDGRGAPREFFATSPPPNFPTFDAGKPLIAAINGYCLAGGLELALACDLRFAAADARLGLPEVTRGFFAGAGGPQRLMRQLPEAVAMDLILTGEQIDAPTALRAGLVSRIFAPDDLLPRTMEVARRIATFAPLGVRASREVARTSRDLPLAQALRLGSSLRWIIGQTEDAKEGPRAFAEKRQPQYRGQ